MTDKTLLLLMIMRIPGLRTAERNILGRKFENEDELSGLNKKDIESIISRSLPEEKWTMKQVKIQAEKDCATAQRQGIKIVSIRDAEYPPLLREIYDPPEILFYRGVLPDPEKPMAAMVGTRQPSPEAASFAVKLGRDLGKCGIPVVSGLALGIDTFSHRGNVEAGEKAVAVLGSGLDQIYPASNRPLAGRIIENGGVLLSEYPPEMGPRKWHFPARNRIISALARGTVIVEAPEKSGALITAAFALEQNRDLWVTEAGVNSARGKGTARLAGEGAAIINSAREILDEWGIEAAGIPEEEKTEAGFPVSGNQAGMALAISMARKLKMKISN